MKKTVALLLALVMTLTLATASAGTWVRADSTVENWDREVDICIVGFGLAGAATAVEAYDIDSETDILVLEKMPVEQAGGNSIASGQTFIVPSSDEEELEKFREYLTACGEPNDIPEEYMDFLTYEMADQLPWIQGVVSEVGYEVGYVGGGELQWGALVVEFDTFPGAGFEGTSAHIRAIDGPSFEYGGVWRAFALATELREIEVAYETPATALVQDPITGEVLGVIAEDADGNEIAIKANKGVVLACGGYENNIDMQRDFHGMDEVGTSGTPGNTGDGIKMLMEAGAQIWHMNNQTQSGGFWLGIKVDEFESTFLRNFTMPAGSWIEVDADSNRFYDESYGYHRQHMKYVEYGRYVDLPHERALPVHLIFDETTRTAGTIVTQWLSWPITTDGYVWSSDNQAELDKGWIVQADTIEELAVLIDRDPDELVATIEEYNAMVDAGEDTLYGRDITTMEKIENGPFYAVEMIPSLVATTGGAKRDTNSRVLDWNDEPILGLYEAGELGSYVSNLYQNGVFLSEAIVSGRAAAQHILGGESEVKEITVAAEKVLPWTVAEDGQYSAAVSGLHDPFTVVITVEDGMITAVEAGEGSENLYMTEDQFAEYADAIVAAQSSEVDIISGATVDCQAIQEALTLAFE